MLEIRNLSLSFKKTIFDNVNFDGCKGEIISISGPSGSGKTSLLKFISGEVRAQTGSIYYNNHEVNHDSFLFNYVSYIDQFNSCFTNMTIKGHFDFYSHLYNISINKNIIQHYLDKVNLSYININKSPSKLSIGERKRFLIAIALMLKKQIILLDEPTASLDNNNIDILLEVIKELSLQGVTFIISTHNDKVINISNTVYNIENCKLIKTCLKEVKGNFVDDSKVINDPRNICYFKYKNLRQVLLLIAVCIFGGLALSFVSHTISQSVIYRLESFQNMEGYKNNRLYLFKATDERTSLDGHKFFFQDVDTSYLDIINNEELKKLENIDGVVDIDYSIILQNDNSTTLYDGKETNHYIQLYQNKKPLKSVNINYYLENFRRNYNCEIFVVGYFDNDHIPKDGTLINETLANLINIEDFNNISLELDMIFPHSFYYDTDFNNYTVMNNHQRKQKLEIQIDGVIKNSEYTDPRFYDYQGVIYVPIDKLKEILCTIPNIDYIDLNLEYISRQYVIFCESSFDEQIKLSIENIDDSYYVESPSLSNKDMISLLNFQNNSNLYINVMITAIMSMAIILLEVYYIKIRKSEIHMLKQIGVRKYIFKYLCQDDYFIMFIWLCISLLSYLVVKLLLGLDLYISSELHLTVWVMTTVLVAATLFGIKAFYLKRIIRR